MAKALTVVRAPEGDEAFNSTGKESAFGGAYEGASRLNRQTALWSAPSLPADMEISPDKVRLDARTRELIRNDGHLAGDKVLKIIAGEIAKRLRKTDFIARFGGEEFVLLIPSSPGRGSPRPRGRSESSSGPRVRYCGSTRRNGRATATDS